MDMASLKTCDTLSNYHVVVVGAGAAGITAAIAAAKSGKQTLLIESGSVPGGELISGMPVDGAVNARGEWILGGVGRELFDECNRLGGYIGPINDHRLIYYVAFDPEIMKIAIIRILNRYGVDLLIRSFVCSVNATAGKVHSLTILNKSGLTDIQADVFLDCSGDGDLCVMSGASFVKGGDAGAFQPVSLMFRLSGVETEPLLDFARKNPESLALGESETMRAGRTDSELAESLYQQGQPAVFFKGNGPLMGDAIRKGDLFPTALIMIQPTSKVRKEVCLNATRVANIDATDTAALSGTLGILMEQVLQCTEFMRIYVPGFQNSTLAATAPRLGIRETRRIIGEYVLVGSEVLEGKKSLKGVAKGCHHVDIHQDGTGQIRIPVANGGSYDIPWGCLIPKGLSNVLMAGRCVSSDRDANGSLRVMGSCMGMGHAIGMASTLLRQGHDVRELPIKVLRSALLQSGAILEGVY
jgi:hypothetical protein